VVVVEMAVDAEVEVEVEVEMVAVAVEEGAEYCWCTSCRLFKFTELYSIEPYTFPPHTGMTCRIPPSR
jgi:hypothetical protein